MSISPRKRPTREAKFRIKIQTEAGMISPHAGLHDMDNGVMSMSTADGILLAPGDDTPRVFFAYPSAPAIRAETIRVAAAAINKTNLARLRTWEDMSVSGKNIIHEICNEIDRAQLFCADITGLNSNVMFELGYAIARDKRIWLVFDTTFLELRRQFDQFQLLTTTGYAEYAGSHDIVTAFLREQPFADLDNTLFRKSIQPRLSASEGDILFYLKSRHDTNASNRITRLLRESEIPQIVDDPNESPRTGKPAKVASFGAGTSARK
jgi:hypothetical protein